jgi:hypothetical protein
MSDKKTIKDFVAKPQLEAISTDSELMRGKYAQDLEFYVYDYIPLAKFYKLTDAKDKTRLTEDWAFEKLLSEYVYDEDGNKEFDDLYADPIVSHAIWNTIMEYYTKKYLGSRLTQK